MLSSFIGPPLRDAFATFLETTDTELIGAALALSRERLSAKGLYENELYRVSRRCSSAPGRWRRPRSS